MHTPVRRVLLIAAAVCAVALAGTAQTAAAEGNGLAATPPMGWNDWYSSYCSVSAQLVELTAQEMAGNGMKAAGYDYVNIDDCWMAPSRDAAGNLVPDPTRFPNGIAPVAAYVHSLGMKLGIYEDAGTTTCAHLPGSYGHEAQDAATFAAWGVDYVKYDRCNIPYTDFPGESEQQVQQTLYTRMSDALKATGRPMIFSMCNPDPGDDPWLWGAPISNLWRTTTDIEDNFGSMLGNFEGTVGLYRDAGPGAWNDPDLLQIGNGGSSLLEYTSEFSLWAEMAAPLIASTNIGTLTAAERAIYENSNVIAVDQDPLGRPGVPISRADGLWVMTKTLSDGSRAVLLFNSTNTAATIATTATAVGLPARRVYGMQNLWTNAVSQTGGGITAFVPGHGVAMFRVSVEPKRHTTKLPPHTVLSLNAADTQLDAGQSTTLYESLTNNGVSDVKKVVLSLAAWPGWQVKPLGRTRLPLLAAGQRFTVGYRITAPASGPPLAMSIFSGGASFDPPDGRHTSSARLGELVSAPVPAPLATADVTTHPASFGAVGRGLAISARGLGVFNPPFGAAQTDSYAAIYRPGGAARNSSAEVTVTSDPAAGPQGGAGLIERDRMTAPKRSPEAVVLYVSGNATVVMAWNASGGGDVDQHTTVPSVTVKAPVGLRLVRRGHVYTGYYSTDRGKTWNPVGTVTVAASASAGRQDVGVFHSSGLSTWTTTASFTNFRAR
ncbi:MAG TPA: NEW3 domain-containing protein [Solirubrobacteraceae bacterium]|nr:NEW3 domain-containing protein [Solirubrobacteraceae bacterium]